MGAGLPAMQAPRYISCIAVTLSQHGYLHSYPLGMCTYPLLRSRPLLVPLLQRVTFGKEPGVPAQPKVTKRAPAPPLGASPRLGMPAVRHCSVGPPRSAIHGRVAATPASMPGCPLRNTCLRPAWFNGAPEIKIKSQIKNRAKAEQKQSKSRAKAEQQQSNSRARAAKLHSPVGAGLPAIEISRPIHLSTDRPPSRRPPNHCWIAGTPRLGEVPSGGSPASDVRSPWLLWGSFFTGRAHG